MPETTDIVVVIIKSEALNDNKVEPLAALQHHWAASHKLRYEATFSVFTTQTLVAFAWLVMGFQAKATLIAVLVFGCLGAARHGLHWFADRANYLG